MILGYPELRSGWACTKSTRRQELRSDYGFWLLGKILNHRFQEVKAWFQHRWTGWHARWFGHWSCPELDSWRNIFFFICHRDNMWYLLILDIVKNFHCLVWCLRLVFVASIYSGILVWIADRLALKGFSLQTPLRQFQIGQANTFPISKHWSSICQWPSSTCFVCGLVRCRETCMWKLETCLRKCWAVMLGVVTGNMVAMMLAASMFVAETLNIEILLCYSVCR